MPHGEPPPVTRGVVLRGFLLAIAVALSGVAAWLIVTSTTQKRVEIGVLTGLWAALVAAFAMFGTRRLMHPLDTGYDDAPSAELELRTHHLEIERAQEAAARRAFEARLEHMLRSEFQHAIGREVSALRAEIAEMRAELLEKVGGQLRLERIETRVIGSVEALQDEVRQLKAVARDATEVPSLSRLPATDPAPLRQIVEPARVRPVTRETAEVEADVQIQPVEPAGPVRLGPPLPPAPQPFTAPSAPAPVPQPTAFSTPAAQPAGFSPPTPPPQPPTFATPAPQPPTFATPAPQPSNASTPAPSPAPQPAPRPTPPAETREARPQPAPAPEPAPSRTYDEFASLPRIRPFTDFELDPIEDEPAYTGRRRRGEQTDGDSGRHAQPEGTGRRHRRDDDDDQGDDLLARLLAREGTR